MNLEKVTPTIEAYRAKLATHLNQLPPLVRRAPNQPVFSVVTIVLNAEKTLRQTIESVVAQNYPNIEYIIVDGLSKDGSVEIVKSFGGKITYWFSEKDTGIADAFNKGVALCRGDWIGVLNADDWYEPDIFSRLAETARANPSAEILTGQTRFWSNEKPTYVFHADSSKLWLDTTIGHQAVFVHRQVYEKHALYRTDLRYASDYDFFVRTYRDGVHFQNLEYVVANMRDEGMSDLQWPKVYKEVARVQKERLGRGWKADARLAYKMLRTRTSRLLTQSGLEPIVTFYRKHFSVLRKDKA